MKNTKILVVDDESVVRETIKRILEDEGFCVVVAEDGQSAINFMKKNEVDIALLDIKLPDINGVVVLEKIKIQQPTTKIVMMTAYEVEEQIKKAFTCGAYACLHKPFEIQTLLKIIKELQDRNHA